LFFFQVHALQLLPELDSLFDLKDSVESRVGDNKWDFGDFFNTVTHYHYKSGDSSDSKGRAYIKPSLLYTDLPVPLSPGFGRSKHMTSLTHITESSLTSTVSTSTRNMGDTRNTSGRVTCPSLSPSPECTCTRVGSPLSTAACFLSSTTIYW